MSNESFGKFLKDLRIKKGFSIYRLSKESGVSHTYISQIEHGVREQPSPEIIKKLAIALDESYAVLMFEVGHITDLEFWDYASEDTERLRKQITEPLPRSYYLDQQITEYVHLLISNREHPFYSSIEGAIHNQIGEIFRIYEIKTDSNITVVEDGKVREDVWEQYADLITSSTDNIQFKWDCLQELQDIAHDFHLRFNSAYEVGARQPRSKKLEDIIENQRLSYNNRELTVSDRQRILDMLKIIFPDQSSNNTAD